MVIEASFIPARSGKVCGYTASGSMPLSVRGGGDISTTLHLLFCRSSALCGQAKRIASLSNPLHFRCRCLGLFIQDYETCHSFFTSQTCGRTRYATTLGSTGRASP